MTGIGTGLAATLGMADEATVGTFVAPTRFFEFDNESIALKKTTVESSGLYGGIFQRAKRRAYVSRTADGKFQLDAPDQGLGLLLKHIIGSNPAAPTQVGTSSYYQQVHVPDPAGLVGKSFSLQKGVPQVNGTLQAFSYRGCKVTDWTLTAKADTIVSLDATIDAWDEDTTETLAVASYADAEVFNFAEGSVLVGGTATTTAGFTTVTGATAIATATEFDVTGKHTLDVKRFYLGTDGIKAEQLENGFRSLAGNVALDFENLTDAYDAFSNDTPTALEFQLTSPSGSALDILFPAIYWDSDSPQVGGPTVVNTKAAFIALHDDAGNPPVQVLYTSLDKTI